MKLSMDEIDREIHAVEERIAVERAALNEAVNGCTNSVREVLTSPKTLVTLLGVGYGIGKLFTGKSNGGAAPTKPGMLGLITGVAGTALSLAQPKLGVGSIARWALSKAFSRKANKSGAAPDGIS